MSVPRRIGVLVIAALICVWGLPAGAQEPTANQSSQPGPNYVIGTGDILFISQWKDDALTHEVIVLPDGTITFPLIGEIPAAGKTVEHLRRELEDKIRKFIPDPTLTIMVRSIGSMKIYLIGRVNRPGQYPIHSDINVLQALSLSGGLTPFAKKDQIKIFRKQAGQTLMYTFDYDEVVEGKNLRQNILLQRDDTIVVP
jgi:polysaccharide export outer membrane protein